MKKRTQAKNKRLVDRQMDQSQVIFFPDHIDRTYELYASYRSGSMLNKRNSWKEVLGHTAQLLLWFVLLTSFFVSQRALLHQPTHAQLPFGNSLTKTAERPEHPRL